MSWVFKYTDSSPHLSLCIVWDVLIHSIKLVVCLIPKKKSTLKYGNNWIARQRFALLNPGNDPEDLYSTANLKSGCGHFPWHSWNSPKLAEPCWNYLLYPWAVSHSIHRPDPLLQLSLLQPVVARLWTFTLLVDPNEKSKLPRGSSSFYRAASQTATSQQKQQVLLSNAHSKRKLHI